MASKKKVLDKPAKGSEKGIFVLLYHRWFPGCCSVCSGLLFNGFVILFIVILCDSESEDDGEAEIREMRIKNKHDRGL